MNCSSIDMAKSEENRIEVMHIALAWLDPGIHTTENEIPEKQIALNFGRCRLFNTVDSCQNFIENNEFHTRLVLIVSGQLGSQLVPSIHSNPHVSAIYVYCANIEAHKKWAKNYSKVRAVLNNFDQLISKIRADQGPP